MGATTRPEAATAPKAPTAPGARKDAEAATAPAAATAAGAPTTPTAPTTPAAATAPGAAAARDLEAALASVRPGLLVAEDVQHADEHCLTVLRNLLREPPERFAAVLTYRPEDLSGSGLLLGRAVDYPARLSVTRCALEPLDERGVRALADEFLGVERCSVELVARLLRRSAGVPQVLVDLLCALRDAGPGRDRFTVRDVDAAGVPVRLAESVLGRTAALPEPHRPVVWAAAVLGRPSDARDLSAVAGLPEEAAREALVAALAASALQETDEGRYGFAVPLAASAVHRHLPGPVREQLHRRAAAVLTAREPVPWARVARHWRGCGRTEEWLRATERVADGEGGGTVTDDETAVALLEQALDEGGGPPRRRARLALALARGATLGLRTEETVRALRRIVADTSLPLPDRGEIRLELGLLLHNQKRRFTEGRDQVGCAVGELSERPVQATQAMAALANPFFPGASLAENRHWLRRAERTAAAAGDDTARTAAAAIRATLLVATGDPEGWELVERLPRDSPGPAGRQQVARALCNTASAAVHLGHHRRGAELLGEGLELAARSDAPFLERVGRGTALFRDWLTGSWAGLAERCTAVLAEDGTANEARVVLALLALARGEWHTAGDRLPPGGPPSFDGCEVPVATTAAGVHIRLLLAREDTGAAASAAASAWTWLGGKGVWAWGAEPAPWAVEALVRAGRRTEAGRLVAEFADGLDGCDAPAARAALLHCRAVLAEADGEPARALGHFRAAGAAYGLLAYPYARALTSEGAGRCAFAAGAPVEEAVAELTGCVERLSRLGASWDAARARATLRAHHPGAGRRPRGRPAYAERLSPREAEVAELAGRGLTNREIASTLHLSPRTVEHHVSRAMRKLGVGLRQELAGRVPRDDPGGAGPVPPG
ncbi:LuxR C-terminal-related transcriptional regulator [Streptomyces lycii]|uniref:Helix-turn-helix transcriptional regulator n=1 Tax=Streptomyces lycii TaxID=2654337 RepID=A0ABQ7FA05_9ACTN|nr:LuxR family transcriptional regulator [Streptomyces lycii]KAF4405020.1 helix-turn-helix transcriptional regulator [Streptomyces lycii]